MPKAFSTEVKALIANLLNYFGRERDAGGPLVPITAVRERVADALNISLSAVSSVWQEVKTGEELTAPKTTGPKKQPVVGIDDFHQVAIRNVIYEMYRNKEHITRESLAEVLKNRNIYNGGLTSLSKILKKIGFKFIKDNPRRGLMELPNIVLKRVIFLEKYIKNINSEDPRQFVYLDETWIFQHGTIQRSWQDNTKESVKKIKTEGKRYIVLHAGNESGFVPGASLVFSSSTKNPDYHGEMNKENFLKWFENQLLKNLDKPSLIVMDNASYHSSVEDKIPNSSWTKGNIKDWLQKQHIQYDEGLFKIQLLDLVARNNPTKVYEVDKLAQQYGHEVLRLPPYHCIFNPIENIWGIAKNYYNKHIGRDGYGVQNVINMWKEALNTITPEIWYKTIEKTNNEIKKYWEMEVGFDREDICPFVININNESDAEDFSD